MPLAFPHHHPAKRSWTRNADNLDFGLVGCRTSVPHLQRLLGHLEDSLKELERAAGA